MVKVNNLEKSINGIKILKNINCEFDVGLTCIVGDSGAGKSTLLNIIGALDEVTSGNVEVYNDIVTVESCSYRATELGFVFQETNLINGLTVGQNIKLGSSIAGNNISDKVILEYLNKFGLEDKIDSEVQVLSGGEKQKVALVRALVKGANIILADEPTGNLDERSTIAVFDALKEISREKIVIVITHNLEKARIYADKIITLKDGVVLSSEVLHKNEEKKQYTEKSNIANTLKFSYVKMLSFNNIRKFVGKFVAMALVLGIAFALVIGIISMTMVTDAKTEEMNYLYYDADQIDVIKSVNSFSKVEGTIMSFAGGSIGELEIEEIQNVDSFAEVVPMNQNLVLYTEENGVAISYKPINLNDFFYNRINGDNLQGAFPSAKDEIIIGKNIADDLYPDGAIGEKITIVDDYENRLTYTIVGINSMKNVDGVYYNYLPYESISELHYKDFYSCFFREDMFSEEGRISYSESFSGILTSHLTGGELIYGDLPDEEGEMVISIETLTELYTEITGEYINFSQYDFSEIDKKMEESIQIVTKPGYYFDLNDCYFAHIVGVHDGIGDEIMVNESWYETMSLIKPTLLQCYAADMSVAENHFGISLPSGFEYISYYAERFETAVQNNNLWKTLFVIIFAVSFILSVMLMNSFSKTSISERMYEIGIIKSLGADKRSIYRLLLFDNLLLGITSSLIAIILYAIFIMMLPTWLGVSVEKITDVIALSLAMFIFAVVISVISCIGKVGKIAKMKPVDAIRRRL